MADFGISEALIATGIAVSLASVGLGVASAEQASKANKINAQTSLDQANFEAQRVRQRNMRVLGAQRATAAKNGVALDTGSYNDILSDSSIEGELDAQAVEYKGKIGQFRLNTEADLQRNNAYSNAAVQAGGSLLTGAQKGYDSYANQNLQPIPRATAASSLDF